MRRIVIGILAVLAAAQVGCNESSTTQRAKKQEAERRESAKLAEQQQRAILAELAAPHNAVIMDRRSFAWTAEVQDALMPEDGRPVAGIASLSDVERDGKSYVVRLIYGNFLMTSIVLMLRCERPTEKGASGLFAGDDRMLMMMGPRYAFVAKIDSVKAVREVVVARDESGSNVRRAGWVAEGRCLMLRKMPVDEKTTKSSQTIEKLLEEMPLK